MKVYSPYDECVYVWGEIVFMCVWGEGSVEGVYK